MASVLGIWLVWKDSKQFSHTIQSNSAKIIKNFIRQVILLEQTIIIIVLVDNYRAISVLSIVPIKYSNLIFK